LRRGERERGAAAVEFALVFPLVIMLLITVIEFSRLWNIQATISDAAMVSARYAAVHADDPDITDLPGAATAEATAIPGLFDWSTASIDVAVDCEGAGVATSSISVAPGSITTWFSSALGTTIELSATGRMPCNG
jgi:Flp pilus assembly protein TadG